MEEPQYDDNLLRLYLLGSLPEAEAETFDELSFLDDDFAARLEGVENDLVDAYVSGEIGGRELAQFESHYLASPRRREHVKFAEAFRSFAEKKMTTNPAVIVQARVRESPAAGLEPVSQTADETALHQRSALHRHFFPSLTLQRWPVAVAMLLLEVVIGVLVFVTLRQYSQLNVAKKELERSRIKLEKEVTKNTLLEQQGQQAIAQSLNDLALLYRDKGDYAKAESLFQQSLDAFEKTLGPDHPEVAQSLYNLALLYLDKGDYAKAESLFLRARGTYEKAFGATPPEVVQSLNDLYLAKGGDVKAELLPQRAPIIRKKAPWKEPTAAPNIAYFNLPLEPQGLGVGQETNPPVTIAPGIGYIVLSLKLRPAGLPSYRAVLRTYPGQVIVWRSGKLKSRTRADKSSVIDVHIPADKLESQEYDLEVRGISASGAAGGERYYSFSVVKKK